jgi:hypothetical protein
VVFVDAEYKTLCGLSRATGKTAFGDRKNERSQDEEEAAGSVLQCVADGLHRVLANETEALPGGPFGLKGGEAAVGSGRVPG